MRSSCNLVWHYKAIINRPREGALVRNSMEKKHYRHGDVIVKCIENIPTRAKKQDKNKALVLAEGEVTGHSHRIIDGNAALFQFNEKVYLKVQSKIATLSHEEHHEIKLPNGNYEVVIQKDYEPSGWKKVID